MRTLTAALLACLLLGGCATTSDPLRALDREISLERFMGPWHVLASIPIDFPLFSEADAHGAVETYQLDDAGDIDITYRFREGSFAGAERVMRQRGRVFDPVQKTEWRVQLIWPFESSYLIAWVDEDYERAIVGVPNRRYVWVLSRDPVVPDQEYEALLDRVEELGHDRGRVRRVPQRAALGAARPLGGDPSRREIR